MRIIQRPTPNFYALHVKPPPVIVLHVTGGNFLGAVSWLTTSPEDRLKQTGVLSSSSAHAVFDRQSNIVAQLAPFSVGTWHAGVIINPSARALAVLPKTIFGKLKNPNYSTIGLEVAAEYDVNNDGKVELYEKLYTPDEVHNVATYILEEIEPQVGVTYSDAYILTHHDIDSEKPDIEVSRLMVLSELAKMRAEKLSTKPIVITHSTSPEIPHPTFTPTPIDTKTKIKSAKNDLKTALNIIKKDNEIKKHASAIIELVTN